jgi:hypothetical protein
MRIFNRKSQLQRLLDSVDIPGGIKLGIPGGGRSSKTLRNGMPEKDTAVKAGLIAGGLAGLTAGSAGISSLRRRQGRARDHS